MKQIVLFLLLAYKKFLSPILTTLFGHSCRYTPTCSQYTRHAVDKYGIVRGLFLGLKRLSRCHPFSKHTDFYDPLT